MKLLSYKRIIKDKNNEDYLDLIGVVYAPRLDATIVNFIVVDEELVGRADKLSVRAYGTHKHSDIIMKFNGIGNPFSIKLGDIILVPDLSFTENSLKQISDIKKVKSNKTATVNRNSDRLPKIDEKRLERLKKIASKFPNASKNFDSTNRLEDGDSNISKKDGLIYFS